MADELRFPADLIGRLPPTFGPALNEQIRQWELLFPAERRQLRAQMECLSRLKRDEFDRLFAPLFEIEKRMNLPRWEPGAAGLSVHDVGVLARSPLYPQWRGEVERVFAKIDEAAEQPVEFQSLPRLVMCVLPSGLPLQDQELWPELAAAGKWVPLDRPFGQMAPQLAAAVAGRACPAALETDERTWVFGCDARFSGLAATVLSWTDLDALRREFLRRLNAVHRDLRSVDQTSEELRRMDIGRLVGPAIAANPRVREFVRSLLLSGNGSLVFNNSFVQWGASEAIRRAQPQVLIASFGVRPKLKPFSSVVLFEDQSRSNPTPDADDSVGSLVDALKLAEYVHLAVLRMARRPERTVTLMSAAGLNRVLVLGAEGPAAGENVTAFALRWLRAPEKSRSSG